MLRALKVMLIVFGVVEILLGLLFIILPDQAASMYGVSDVSGFTLYLMASFGICLIVPSIFLIMAARDPLRHIHWVKFAIAWCALGAVAGLYSVIKGDVDFGHAGMQIIMDAVFAAVFLFLYPYKAVKRS